MGEFPWQVRVGETVQVKDYIAPPETISSEESHGEVVWSAGDVHARRGYLEGVRAEGTPPPVTGIYANQPSPYQGKSGSAWAVFFLLALLLLVTIMVVRHRCAATESLSAALHVRVRSRRTVVRHAGISNLKGGRIECRGNRQHGSE